MSLYSRHDWYQTESQVVVTIFLRNSKLSNIQVDIKNRKVIFTYNISKEIISWQIGVEWKICQLDPKYFKKSTNSLKFLILGSVLGSIS